MCGYFIAFFTYRYIIYFEKKNVLSFYTRSYLGKKCKYIYIVRWQLWEKTSNELILKLFFLKGLKTFKTVHSIGPSIFFPTVASAQPI